MAINKVVYGNETIIDLTNDTVKPENLLSGFTAHSSTGEEIEGVLVMNGHNIFDYSRNSLSQRSKMTFLDATPTDNSSADSTDITIHREMTQAQFDALSDAEKYGSIVITDAPEAVLDASMVKYGSGTVSDQLDKCFTIRNQALTFNSSTLTATITDTRVTSETYCHAQFTDATRVAARNAGVEVYSASGKIVFTVSKIPDATLVCNILCAN